MKLALDTNRYRDFCEGDQATVALMQLADRILLPFPVLAELRAGFACGLFPARNERTLSLFLDRSRISVLFSDEQTTFHYGRIYAQLRSQGTPIPTNDLWIAAIVVQHGLTLCTRDRHFRHLPQIPVV